jgi:hypothetical protein
MNTNTVTPCTHPESVRHTEHRPVELHLSHPMLNVDSLSQHRPTRHASRCPSSLLSLDSLPEPTKVSGASAVEQIWRVSCESSPRPSGEQRAPGASAQVPLMSTDPPSHSVHCPLPSEHAEHFAVALELQHTPPRHTVPLAHTMSESHGAPSAWLYALPGLSTAVVSATKAQRGGSTYKCDIQSKPSSLERLWVSANAGCQCLSCTTSLRHQFSNLKARTCTSTESMAPCQHNFRLRQRLQQASRTFNRSHHANLHLIQVQRR